MAHPTKTAAQDHIGRLVREEGADPDRYELYRCRHHPGPVWHVGHSPASKR